MFDFLLATGELDEFITEDVVTTEKPSGASPVLPAGVEYVGERNGKPHYRAMGVAVEMVKPQPAPKVEKPATYQLVNLADVRVGHTCPRCRAGMYHFHDGRVDKCYWCDGKGVIVAKDMAYLRSRIASGQINLVKTL